jgi:hypothetical protein
VLSDEGPWSNYRRNNWRTPRASPSWLARCAGRDVKGRERKTYLNREETAVTKPAPTSMLMRSWPQVRTQVFN